MFAQVEPALFWDVVKVACGLIGGMVVTVALLKYQMGEIQREVRRLRRWRHYMENRYGGELGQVIIAIERLGGARIIQSQPFEDED